MENKNNIREFFENYIYENHDGKVNERTAKFCRVGDKCMIVPGTIKFTTAKHFIESVMKIGEGNNLYYAMRLACGMEEHLPTKIYVLIYRNEKWNVETYRGIGELFQLSMQEIIKGNTGILIPYISFENEIAAKMTDKRNGDKPITRWPLIEEYEYSIEDYKLVALEDFLTRFGYHASGKFEKFPIYLNLDYINHKSIITPTELYTVDENCEPILISEYEEQSGKNSIIGSDIKSNAEVVPSNEPASTLDHSEKSPKWNEITNFEDIWKRCNEKESLMTIVPDFDELKRVFSIFGLAPENFDSGFKNLFLSICSKLHENGYKIIEPRN